MPKRSPDTLRLLEEANQLLRNKVAHLERMLQDSDLLSLKTRIAGLQADLTTYQHEIKSLKGTLSHERTTHINTETDLKTAKSFIIDLLYFEGSPKELEKVRDEALAFVSPE